MASFFSMTSARPLKGLVAACGFLCLATQSHSEPGSENPFVGLSGHWSGSGTVTLASGAAERIRCRATYAVATTGKAIQQTLRCASDSYRLEITSNVQSEAGLLSGSWSEATRGMSGSLSGRVRSSDIAVNVTGAGFTAHLDVRTHGDKQSVTIRPQGDSDISAVSIALRKG
jgi:hypothetical protein